MDKLHIYRENTKSFGGQSNRFMSRIGRICGGQAKVRHSTHIERHGENRLENELIIILKSV